MKVVILAGGFGTRISEESHLKPKPMIEIGDMPILWHIMKGYSILGYNEFIICCGYKGYMIKEYFADYYLHRSDITFDFCNKNEMTIYDFKKSYITCFKEKILKHEDFKEIGIVFSSYHRFICCNTTHTIE